MTIASYVSLLRIMLIIPIIFFLEISKEYAALIIFIIAGLTDYADGYIARKTNSETSLGALLDLLADKLFVCIILVWCALISKSLLVMCPAMIIISRELIISSVRQFLVENTGKNPIKVTNIARSKTTMQIVAISFLIISPKMSSSFNLISIILLWAAALISLYSLFNYLKSYREYF